MFLGTDWEWDDQDGGAGNIGSVISVQGTGFVYVCLLTLMVLLYTIICELIDQNSFILFLVQR